MYGYYKRCVYNFIFHIITYAEDKKTASILTNIQNNWEKEIPIVLNNSHE